MYNRGDYLVTEGQTYITDNLGRLILLREHPSSNPNFSIKCSEYFGTNLFNIKTSIQHKQISLTDGSVVDKTNHATTDFIAVSELKNYSFTGNANFFRVAFYNTSKTFISSQSTEVVFNQRWIEDLPSNAKYIRFSAEYFTISNWGFYELTSDRAFAITYFDKKIEVDLVGFYGVTRSLIGTPDLFSLSYISDTKDKGQTIMATEAEINIYQDDFFNIDNLATSGETDIKVKYYENDLLVWNGFVMPDFFEVDIKTNPIISMVATDRLGVLKEIGFNGTRTTPKHIVEDCLIRTGLTLDTSVLYEYSYFDTVTINLERFDGMNCHEVLTSVLTAFNMKVVQHDNKWQIVNKRTLETRVSPRHVTVGLVDVDGMREIKPVASEVSMKLVYGVSQRYPKNWNFRETNFTDIFPHWEFQALISNNMYQVTGYDVSGTEQTARYGGVTGANSLYMRSNKIPSLDGGTNVLLYPHIKSAWATFRILAGVKYKLDFRVNFTSASNIDILAYVMIKKGSNYFAYIKDGSIRALGTDSSRISASPIQVNSADRDSFGVVQTQFNLELDIDKAQLGLSDESDEEVEARIIIMRDRSYTSPVTATDVFINSAELVLNDNDVTGKGLIFKIKQGGAKFSKARKEQVVHFSDKIEVGVNGYFYNYRNDDTSITNLPKEFLLKNSLTEQAQMFGKARNFLKLSGEIKVDPLARYICGDKRYVMVGGSSRRKDASVELEEIVDGNLEKVDYIYTYF